MDGGSDFSQLSALVSSFHTQHHADPLVVDPSTDANDTPGMSFQELFSHYLAPEVAKLPPSTAAAASEPVLPFSFGSDPSPVASTSTGTSTATTFDPSTFLPTLPGSPIGAFSPSSDGASSHRSPMSFPDLDFSATSDPFAIDPSIFSASAGLDYGLSLDTYTPATSAASETPLTSLPSAPLPPLPALPVAPAEVVTKSAPAVPVPSVSTVSATAPTVTASGRPKRNVAHSILDSQDDAEDDDDVYSSDASSVATTRKSTRALSRKPPAAKKARASSSGASDAGRASTPYADAAAAAADKRLARTSVVPLASSDLHKTTANSKLPPVPQWADKPDPQEYSKLSSKEKRQMRNKISARNFRHRRKEYITTLEDEISSRDSIICELRDEVGVIRAENTGLRSEVATLKEKWQDLLDKLSTLSGPVAAPAGTAAAGLGTNPPRVVATAGSSASASASPVVVKEEDAGDFGSLTTEPSATATRRMGTRSGGVARPNLTKDVSALGRRGATGSWATAGGFGSFGGGGYTSVHTTLLPDVNLALGLQPKPSLPPFATQSFNPALNALNANQLADLPAMTAHLRDNGVQSSSAPQPSSSEPTRDSQGGGAPRGTFEDFFASNPYWLRPDQLEQNRAALYGKLANNAAGLVAAQAKTSQQDGYLPLPAGFRPSFFRGPSSSPTASFVDGGASTIKSSTTAELLAYQSPATAAAAAAAADPAPAFGVSHQDATLGAGADALFATARVASIARDTLVTRMWGAFVDAFSGAPAAPPSLLASPSSSIGASAASGLSADKVAAVLGGRARLEVVPVTQTRPAAPTAKEVDGVEALEAHFGNLTLAGASSSGHLPQQQQQLRAASPVGDDRECAFDSVMGRWRLGGLGPKRA